jgi:hypothetical protein
MAVQNMGNPPTDLMYGRLNPQFINSGTVPLIVTDIHIVGFAM